MKPVLVFAIETVPDVPGLRRLHDLDAGLSDAEVAELAFQQRRAQFDSDFLPPHLQRIAVISCALRVDKDFRVWSLAGPAQGEAEIIQGFFDAIEKYTPRIVSWSGGGFDLPVLHYRSLIHGTVAPRYWDLDGDDQADKRDSRRSRYIGRYHTRHLDLMDPLAMHQPSAGAPLDDLARLIGLPGRPGVDSGKVWEAWQAGRVAEIRDCRETDVVNTYLLATRFRLMRGELSRAEYADEIAFVRGTLDKLDKPHWREFLAAWR